LNPKQPSSIYTYILIAPAACLIGLCPVGAGVIALNPEQPSSIYTHILMKSVVWGQDPTKGYTK
jgi:hypothetical protein